MNAGCAACRGQNYDRHMLPLRHRNPPASDLASHLAAVLLVMRGCAGPAPVPPRHNGATAPMKRLAYRIAFWLLAGLCCAKLALSLFV